MPWLMDRTTDPYYCVRPECGRSPVIAREPHALWRWRSRQRSQVCRRTSVTALNGCLRIRHASALREISAIETPPT